MSITVHHGDCLTVLEAMRAESVHAVVTDPPYHLTSIVKRWGGDGPPTKSTDAYARASAGFMGKKWDGGDIAFRPATWAAVYRVMKPGAHLLAFGGTRGFHRMFCAIEDAGFEIRDCASWLYGSGFPKSHNIGDGWGTALKPAWEPICVARKPFKGTVAANVLKHGTGAINVDGCRVGTGEDKGVWPVTERRHNDVTFTLPPTETDTSKGRWPANVLHDGSEEVVGAFPESNGQQGDVRGNEPSSPMGGNTFGRMDLRVPAAARGDSGSAARFFYSAKADAGDRLGSKHPTVKPVDLMRWLVRLVTPTGGVVLDPFAGSGATGSACMAEGFDCILIEKEAEYYRDILKRIEHVQGGDTPLFAGRASA